MQMVIHSETNNSDVSSTEEFQKHLSNKSHKNGVINQGKYKKGN